MVWFSPAEPLILFSVPSTHQDQVALLNTKLLSFTLMTDPHLYTYTVYVCWLHKLSDSAGVAVDKYWAFSSWNQLFFLFSSKKDSSLFLRQSSFSTTSLSATTSSPQLRSGAAIFTILETLSIFSESKNWINEWKAAVYMAQLL